MRGGLVCPLTWIKSISIRANSLTCFWVFSPIIIEIIGVLIFKDKFNLKPPGGEGFYAHYDGIFKWLDKVEIDKSRVDDFPRTFSGGMLQRLQIAKNLVTSPKIIFMDEPTGGLDVSVQAKILDLLRKLVRELNLSVVIVSHDLAVIRLLADKIIVMKNGEAVESGLCDQVLDDPQHSYTQLLVSSVLQV